MTINNKTNTQNISHSTDTGLINTIKDEINKNDGLNVPVNISSKKFDLKSLLINLIDGLNEALKNPEVEKSIDELVRNITYKIDNINKIKEKFTMIFTINLKNSLTQKIKEIKDILKDPEIMNSLLDITNLLPITVKNVIHETNEKIQKIIVDIEFDLSFIRNNNLKDLITNKIKELNDLVKDPNVKHDLKELATELGGYGNIALQAAMPEIKSMIPDIIQIFGKSADKLSNTLVNLLLNMGTTIPGVGSVIGAVRVFDSSVKTATLLVETNMEIVKKMTEKFNTFSNKFMNILDRQKKLSTSSSIPKNQLGGTIKKANEIMNRVNKSISRFHRTTSKIKTRRRIKY
jgi:hypothetical protein